MTSEHAVPAKTRVLLADDHPTILSGLASALSSHHISVIDSVIDPHDVEESYFRFKPDVLVLDIQFGKAEKSGLDVARSVLRTDPNAKIVFFSQYDTPGMILAAFQLGALAYMTKNTPIATMADAITAASQGQKFLTPKIAEVLADLAISGEKSPEKVLSAREMEVFRLVAMGDINAEIAEKLGLSLRTISNISQAVKDKLGIHRQADLTKLAIKLGLISTS